MSEIVRRNSIQENGELDWEDVEMKVQIISRKFSSTIDWKYLEDLEQELRLFAWTKSSNYWDMYRRGVDYWRMLTRRVFPEVCVFEFDVDHGQAGMTYDEYNDKEQFNLMVVKIREAIEEYQTSTKEKIDHDNCIKILGLIEEWVDGRLQTEPKFTKGKFQIDWVSEVLDIPYPKVQDAFWLLKKVIETLAHLGRIEVPANLVTAYVPF